MGRIKIKCDGNPKERRSKLKLLEILAPAEVYATALHEAYDGYIVITATDKEVDKILEPAVTQNLKTQGFTPILPQEVKSRRTIICYMVEQTAFENTENDIADEIEYKQDWAKIQSTYKFPNSRNMLKVQFESVSMADKAANQGLRLFHVSIAPHQISKERYINIPYCMKCYAIDDHATNQCPKPQGYQICSECSSQNHTWRNCRTEEKKCINCGGAHRTLAYKCPKRKEKGKEKQQEAKQKASQSYSQTLAPPTNAPTFPSLAATIGNNQISKMMLCYVHAHAMNTVHPGTFQKTLIDSLKENNLPTVILQSHNPPSQQIIQNLMPSETTQHSTVEPETDLEEDLKLSTDSDMETETEAEDQETEQAVSTRKNSKKTSATKSQTGATRNNDTLQVQALSPFKQKAKTTKDIRTKKPRCNKRR